MFSPTTPSGASVLCASSTHLALHFDLGVDQACSAAARVLLASPSRASPSSCSSPSAFLSYEAYPSRRGALPADPRFLWVRSPFFWSYVFVTVLVYARDVRLGERTDVLSRPRLSVPSGIALHMSSLLTVCSAVSLSSGAARRVFPVATEYNFQFSAE